MTRLVVAFVGLIVFASCGVSVGPQKLPEITYYHLAIPAPEVSGEPLDLNVAVMPLSQSAALDRDGVRYRKSDVEGGFWEHHRWAEPVESMLRTALQQDLDRAGAFRRVVLLEDSGHAGVLIVGEVVRFDEEDQGDGWTAVVEIDFDVVRRHANGEVRDEIVLSRSYRGEEPVADKSVAEVVRSLSRATAAVFANLRADLAEVLP